MEACFVATSAQTYEDNLEEHLLVDLHELLVPVVNLRWLFARVVVLICGLVRIVLVVLAPLDHLPHDGLVDLGVLWSRSVKP
jgi:hypothetical protein